MNLENYVNYSRNCPDYIKFITEFLFDTGIRPTTLLSISKNKLSYINGEISYTQSKTKILRTIKLSPNVLTKARYWRKERGNFAKNFRNYNDLKRQVMTFVQMLYVPEHTNTKLYYFRYLYVLRLLKSGMSKERISRKLGHNDLSTVNDYIKHAREIEGLQKKRSKRNG